ncbi:fimbrial assembly protein [Pantoea wallisii]|uniref:Fimbrial assembly protein n=1 Tax=Pantoea wallisii TaxID=1076551 RepID=A0A1X1DA18_9GAMM|nr:PilN domain-containing protein [Pantoea wallisii]ORM73498.1 fimbrial assembly protein [Pantoea wallisii]
MLAVNLLPWRAQQWQRTCHLTRVLLISTLAGTLLLTFLGWWHGERLYQQRAALLIRQTGVLAALQQQLAQQQVLLQQRDALLATQQARVQRQIHHQRWQQFWLQLPALMPDTLWLSRLERQQGQVQLQGLAQSMAAVGEFRRQLLAQPLFTAVQQGSVQRQTDGYYHFALRARMQEGSNE